MSKTCRACRGLLCGAALLALPSLSLAQNTSTADNVVAEDGFTPNAADTMAYDNTVTTTDTREDDDDDFPWGLLGLIGLAGLIPRKHKAADINVDARRD